MSSSVSITIDGASVLSADAPAGGEKKRERRRANERRSLSPKLATPLSDLLSSPLPSPSVSPTAPASAAFAALKASIGTCLTAIMKEQAIEEGEAGMNERER